MFTICLAPDCNTVAVAPEQSTGRFALRKLSHSSSVTYGNHNGHIKDFSFSADSLFAASIGEDGLLHVWDLVKGQPQPYRSWYADDGNAVRFSNSSPSLLLSTHRRYQLLLTSVDAISSKYISSARDSQGVDFEFGEITCIDWGQCGQVVAFGTQQGETMVIDLYERFLLMCDKFHDSAVQQVAVQQSRGFLATVGGFFAHTVNDLVVKVVDIYNKEVLLHVKPGSCTTLAFSPSGNLFVFGCADGNVYMYETQRFKLLHQTRYNDEAVAQLRFRDDDTLFLVTSDCKVCEIDLPTMRYVRTYDLGKLGSSLRINKTVDHESLIECDNCGNMFWSNITFLWEVSGFGCPSCGK